MKRIPAFLVVFISTNALAQNLEPSNFVIDKSKPFVYIEFDHIGPRKPVQKNEITTGLWLKKVNNCRIPIVIHGNGSSDDRTGRIIFDDVIEIEPVMQVFDSSQAASMQKKEQDRLKALRNKPTGYASEVSGAAKIKPGESLLFGVPLNHVSEYWFMRVKFALDLNASSIAVGPYTYLDFHVWDIPKENRPH
jgi:hypothetical protein